MAIWKEPIFNRTLADVTFAISQIEAWKNSHSHGTNVELLTDEVKVAVDGEVTATEDSIAIKAGNAYIENDTLVLQLGTIYDLKGCLNLSDIIRIENNIAYLAEHLNKYHYPVGVITVEWSKSDIPNTSDIERISRNITIMFNEYYVPRGSWQIYKGLKPYEYTNAIEGNLYLIKEMLDAMVASFISSGTTKCGAGRLPLRR